MKTKNMSKAAKDKNERVQESQRKKKTKKRGSPHQKTMIDTEFADTVRINFNI